MTAEHGVFLAGMASGIAWAVYLLVSLFRDVRKKPWWREREGGDVIDFTRRLK